jgi:Response regulator containing CheY-like receiver, AAA-type ATPase, and DNA-binding domains
MHKEILVIDDNPDIRLLVSNILKEKNFLVELQLIMTKLYLR